MSCSGESVGSKVFIVGGHDGYASNRGVPMRTANKETKHAFFDLSFPKKALNSFPVRFHFLEEESRSFPARFQFRFSLVSRFPPTG
jgi:hypothetical protein